MLWSAIFVILLSLPLYLEAFASFSPLIRIDLNKDTVLPDSPVEARIYLRDPPLETIELNIGLMQHTRGFVQLNQTALYSHTTVVKPSQWKPHTPVAYVHISNERDSVFSGIDKDAILCVTVNTAQLKKAPYNTATLVYSSPNIRLPETDPPIVAFTSQSPIIFHNLEDDSISPAEATLIWHSELPIVPVELKLKGHPALIFDPPILSFSTVQSRAKKIKISIDLTHSSLERHFNFALTSKLYKLFENLFFKQFNHISRDQYQARSLSIKALSEIIKPNVVKLEFTPETISKHPFLTSPLVSFKWEFRPVSKAAVALPSYEASLQIEPTVMPHSNIVLKNPPLQYLLTGTNSTFVTLRRKGVIHDDQLVHWKVTVGGDTYTKVSGPIFQISEDVIGTNEAIVCAESEDMSQICLTLTFDNSQKTGLNTNQKNNAFVVYIQDDMSLQRRYVLYQGSPTITAPAPKKSNSLIWSLLCDANTIYCTYTELANYPPPEDTRAIFIAKILFPILLLVLAFFTLVYHYLIKELATAAKYGIIKRQQRLIFANNIYVNFHLPILQEDLAVKAAAKLRYDKSKAPKPTQKPAIFITFKKSTIYMVISVLLPKFCMTIALAGIFARIAYANQRIVTKSWLLCFVFVSCALSFFMGLLKPNLLSKIMPVCVCIIFALLSTFNTQTISLWMDLLAVAVFCGISGNILLIIYVAYRSDWYSKS